MLEAGITSTPPSHYFETIIFNFKTRHCTDVWELAKKHIHLGQSKVDCFFTNLMNDFIKFYIIQYLFCGKIGQIQLMSISIGTAIVQKKEKEKPVCLS